MDDVPEKSGSADRPIPRGVIIDWGGVLTSPIASTINAWIDSSGVISVDQPPLGVSPISGAASIDVIFNCSMCPPV